jgi:4-amino-4-deoxy-L-arabinose transferase-like glycosyltransferase
LTTVGILILRFSILLSIQETRERRVIASSEAQTGPPATLPQEGFHSKVVPGLFGRRPYILITVVALAVRLAVIPLLSPEQLSLERDHWRFGYETGRVARSIVEGHGFASPLFEETGLTAWFTPLYPYLVAGVFKLFGIYSERSLYVLMTLNGLTSALTCVPIFLIARKQFGERAAKRAAWVWAFFPWAIYFPMERVWETWLATLLLTLLFLVALHLEHSDRIWPWVGFGALWAAAALNSPVSMAVLPPLGAWICYRLHQQGKRWFVPAVTATLVLVALVMPWMVRNQRTFHQFVPLRSGLGLELWVGNNGDTSHWHPRYAGPWHNEAEFAEFKRLGEVPYMAKKREMALAFIRAHPAWFVWVSLRRAVYLWTGFWSFDRSYLKEEPMDLPNILVSTSVLILALIGLRRAYRSQVHAALPYLCILLFFPLIYYVTHPEVYYLRPLDPFLVLLATSRNQMKLHA